MGMYNRNQSKLNYLMVRKMDELDRRTANYAEEYYSEEDKLRAAYALNLCMVSVSQIIDYNDIYILEQEYEMILNNLNLEQMPKDEALLNILKQLLDTITFFRIQEGDKKFMDKEYQQEMKSAIWSAVPNIGLIVAGGNPVTMAVSLASQIGIGYMNYRKQKAEINQKREKQEWQIQRSAIEQFNGLRRELFDTAWRLADRYNFPDEYRLTERQIEQYNKILMDTDSMRKYERLDSIKDKFQAYPPFWYHFGNTANTIAQNTKSSGIRKRFIDNAKAHFETFQKANKYKLLREDQISSSCALEYVDLLDVDSDKEKICGLLKSAIDTSGNANDVLELCALAYMRVGETSAAAPILRKLVNEDYNTVVNAQMLSSIYVSEFIKTHSSGVKIDYELLEERVMPNINPEQRKERSYLFPMPAGGALDEEKLQHEFIEKQKMILLEKYFLVFEEFDKKYNVLFNKVIPMPDEQYPDNYYMDIVDDKHDTRRERFEYIKKVLENKRNKTYAEYFRKLQNADNIGFEYLEVLNKMCFAIRELDFIKEQEQYWHELVDSVKDSLKSKKDEMSSIIEEISEENITEFLEYLEECSFEEFTHRFFDILQEKAEIYVENLKVSMAEFAKKEAALREFCIKQNIPEPEVLFMNADYCDTTIPDRIVPCISADLLGQETMRKYEQDQAQKEMMNGMKKIIADNKNIFEENYDKAKIEFLVEEYDINAYLSEKKLELAEENKKIVVAVLDSKGFLGGAGKDLIFTTEDVILVSNNQQKAYAQYKDINYSDSERSAIKIKNEIYENKYVDVSKLLNLCKELSNARVETKYDSVDNEKKEEMQSIIKNRGIIKNPEKVELITVTSNRERFEEYLDNRKLKIDKEKVIAILDDKTGGLFGGNEDLIFTVDGIIPVYKNKQKEIVKYNDTEYLAGGDGESLRIGKEIYDNKNVFIYKLKGICVEFQNM